MQGDALTAAGKIGQGTLIVRMDAVRALLTERARCALAGSDDSEMNRRVGTPETVNADTRDSGKEEIGKHGRLRSFSKVEPAFGGIVYRRVCFIRSA